MQGESFSNLINNLIGRYPTIPVLLKSLRNRIQAVKHLGLVGLDAALHQPRGKVFEQFAGQLMIFLRGLSPISIEFSATRGVKGVTYRPVECAVPVVFKEGRPNQHIGDMGVRSDLLGVGLPWSHRT